jgi:hypothetical protein
MDFAPPFKFDGGFFFCFDQCPFVNKVNTFQIMGAAFVGLCVLDCVHPPWIDS